MFNVKTEMMTLAKWQIVKNIEEIFKTVFTLLKSVPCKKKLSKKSHNASTALRAMRCAILKLDAVVQRLLKRPAKDVKCIG